MGRIAALSPVFGVSLLEEVLVPSAVPEVGLLEFPLEDGSTGRPSP